MGLVYWTLKANLDDVMGAFDKSSFRPGGIAFLILLGE